MWWLLALWGCQPHEQAVPPFAAATADAGPDRTVLVDEPIALLGTGTGRHLEWDFGDGTRAFGAAVTHVYRAPGNYVAVLSALDEGGTHVQDDVQVTVHLRPAAQRPTWSSSLARDDLGQLWAVTPEADVVAIVGPGGQTRAVVPVCEEPRTVAFDGQRIAVACETGAVTVLSRAGAVLDTIALPAGSRPHGIVGRNSTWWVALEGTGEVAELRDGEVTRHRVGPGPRGIALDPRGQVFTTRFRSDGVGQIHALGGRPLTLVEDPGPDSDTGIRGVPNLLQTLAISPDGGTLYVPGLLNNVARGAWRDGQPLTHETTLRGFIGFIDLVSGEEHTRKQFDDQDRALAIAVSPLGNLLYVSHPGTKTVHVLDAWSHAVVGSILGAGNGVTGLQTDGERLYVHAWLDRTVAAYDVTDLSTPPRPLWTAEVVDTEPLDAQVLRGKRIFYDSFDTRMSKDGYLTCASCHPDGRDDGQTWDFTDRGEGLRNTTSLEGRGGTDMGRLHWTGNFDEVQDFENDIRNAFGGHGFLDDADWNATSDTLGTPKAGRSKDLDALAAYVASLTTTPASPFPARDDALFTASGCAGCHPAPLYTDSDVDAPVRHDVGTALASSGQRLGGPLDGFDTPTLLGAWSTGPWLHDGSAPTLEDAITAHTSVSASDARALADFVRGL